MDNAENLSEAWKAKFKIIEEAGGVKLPDIKKLSSSDARKIRINWYAFFFTVFYYLYLKMWRKALTLTLISVGAIYFVEFAIDLLVWQEVIPEVSDRTLASLNVITSVIFAQRANIDYYKKVVLNNDEWL